MQTLTTWFRPARWDDGRHISILDDRRATVLVTVYLVVSAAGIAGGGAARMLGAWGDWPWPTAAAAAVVAVVAWLWSRRRLAGVSGVERGLRWDDGHHVNARCDPVALRGYRVCGAALSVALYATGAHTARIEVATLQVLLYVLALVGGVVLWALPLRLHSLARADAACRSSA